MSIWDKSCDARNFPRYKRPEAAVSRWCEMSLSDYLSAEEASYGLPVRSGGHVWQEGIHGRACTGCGRRWAEVVGGGQQHFTAEVDWLWATIVEAAGQ